MSFLKKIFGSEITAQSVRELLAGGDAQRALDQARRLHKRAADSTTEALVAECERAVVQEIFAKSDAAREEGFVDDAIEWLSIARHKLGASGAAQDEPPASGSLLGELERREQELEGLRSAAAAASLRQELHGSAVADTAGAPRDEKASEEELGELDLLEDADQHFAALLNTLREDVAERYVAAGREDAAFRAAVVLVNEGEGEQALAQLRELEPEKSGLCIVRLERGRALLQQGEHRAAVAELAAAMEELGEGALDHQEATVLLELWAEAALESGELEEVRDRLGASALLERRPPMVELYTDALHRLGEEGEALETLRAAVERFPMQSDFVYQLALRLTRAGEHSEARQVLQERVELALRPGASQLLHSGVLELLSEHLLQEEEPDAGRLHELLDIDAHLLGGTSLNVAWLRSRVLGLEGRSAEAAAAAEVALQLANRQAEAEAASPDAARGHRLVLVEPPAPIA